MYTYGRLTPITFSQVLNLYSQEDIFRIVFGEYPDYNKEYLSPFREDHNPNCFFDWYKGKLYFRDYADVQRDCFKAVKDFYNLSSYREAIKVIDDFYDKNEPLNKTEFMKYRKKCDDRRFYSIFTTKREYELRDELFWKQYYITERQLTDDSVFPISRYRFHSRKYKKWSIMTPFDIAYAIAGFEKEKKIYRPMQKGKTKWLTNCSNNSVGNIKNISTKEDYLIITKSYKDHRVIRNDGFSNTIWFQSESQYPEDKILFDIVKHYSKIIIFYDNDLAGIIGAEKLSKAIKKLFNVEVRTVTSPYRFFKDPASIVSNKSREALHTLLWNSYRM